MVWVKNWVDLKYFVRGEGRSREEIELLQFLCVCFDFLHVSSSKAEKKPTPLLYAIQN